MSISPKSPVAPIIIEKSYRELLQQKTSAPIIPERERHPGAPAPRHYCGDGLKS
jgi:hypothetical protein